MFDPILSWRIDGTRFDARASTLVVLAIVLGGALDRGVVGGVRPLSGAAFIAATAIAVVMVFAIVTLREIARIKIARAFSWRLGGLEVRLFGGVIDDVDTPASPRVETAVAVIAHAVLLGAGLAALAFAFLAQNGPSWARASGMAIASALGALVVLQTMPALHFDGGRVLHALIWHLTDSSRTATVVAGLYAQVIALGMIAGGIMLLAGTGGWPFWGLACAVVGLQLSGSARATARRSVWSAEAARVTLGELPLAPLATIPIDTSIDDAFECLVAGASDAYLLVAGDDGRAVGFLRVVDLRGTKRISWDAITAGAVMVSLADLPRLPAAMPASDAVHRLERAKRGAAIEDDGRVVAVATRGQVLFALAAGQRERAAKDA